MKSKFLILSISFAIAATLTASTSYITMASVVSYNGTSIDANLNATATPEHITLSWTGNPTTTQTITWRTISTDTKSKVQYRVKGTTAWTTSTDVSPKLLTSGTGDENITTGIENIFSTTITGLTPGTIYEYQVIGVDVSSKQNTSSLSSFKTEKSNNTKTKVIVFGDSQSGIPNNPEYTPWNNTIQEAYSQNKDANFVVNMGDLVEIGQNYQHWNNWFSAAKGVIDKIPEMPVQGNHETYQNNNSDSSSPQNFISQFSVPQNGPYGHIGQTYSYDYGNVHFVVLDSQEDEEAPGNDSFLKQQASWLNNDLTNNKQKWTIVMFHKTPYYNKATRNNPSVKDIFTPVIEKHHVDVVFNGHDHGVSRTYPINSNNYYKNYSKGTVYYVTGRSGNKYYTDLNKKIWDATFYDCQDSPAYEVVSVVNGKLNIAAYKYNTIDTIASNKNNKMYNTSTKIDDFTIDKDNPAKSTKLKLTASPHTQLTIAGTIQKENNVFVSKNKAYVDPSLIAKYYKGTYDVNSLTLTVNELSYKFKQTDLLKGDSSKVNVDALFRQGIDVKYNTALNSILVDFTGRITPNMIAAFKGFTFGNVKPSKPVVVHKDQYGVVTGDGVRIRTGAGTQYSSKGAFALETKIKILQAEGSFYKVSHSGITGYVSNQYVKITAK
ncbi:metallophosphoesterase [Clostridium psychrophilum]|uniref:metallophosphoesterase n=1 Tax=Clostridium psychrophilum TaxID=132926 RepID=UPI001C0DBC8E|nr:metallophosphoesterase [Clostridium psychrophilum]MBU3182178.1 metallophosphoesterase [Clostridium psychrophilum]